MSVRPRRAVLAGSGALAATAALAPTAAAPAGTPAPVSLIDTYVVGTVYQPRAAEAAARLSAGDPVLLRRRPDSGYDPRTVEVRTAEDVLLGHLPRIDNQAVARLMDAGVPTSASVRAVRAQTPRPQISVTISIVLT